MIDREQKILDATMEIVSECGLNGFTMRMLSNRTDLNLPLIYAIFPSKEELLYQCFMFVNRQIAGLFKGAEVSPDLNKEEMIEYMHKMWRKYFQFMVENGNRTLYYYIYRDSANLQRILMKNNATVANDMADFNKMFGVIVEKLGLFKNLSPDFFYVLLLDGTGNFVRHIIRDNMTLKEDEIDSIWQLLTGGFLSFSDA